MDQLDESVLRLFCAKDSFDRRLDNPFSRGAFTYATNGAYHDPNCPVGIGRGD